MWAAAERGAAPAGSRRTACRAKKAHLAADSAGIPETARRTQKIGLSQARHPQIAENVATDFRSCESPETSKLPKLRNFETSETLKLRNFERQKLRNFRNPETREK